MPKMPRRWAAGRRPATTAANAANAANQAAGSASGKGAVGTGSPQIAHGASAVALQAAENYLGVPYEYGGAGMGAWTARG